MIWLLLLPGVLSALLLYVTLAPLRLEIRSSRMLCRLSMKGLAYAAVEVKDGQFVLGYRVAGFGKKRTLEQWLEKAATRKDKKTKKETGKKMKEKRKTGSMSWRQVQAVLRTVRVNRFRLHLDTGDQALNGVLYPVFYMLAVRTNKDIRISFTGSETEIDIQCSLARIAAAYIRNRKST